MDGVQHNSCRTVLSQILKHIIQNIHRSISKIVEIRRVSLPIVENRQELPISQNTKMQIGVAGFLSSIISYIFNFSKLLLFLLIIRIIVKYDLFSHVFGVNYLSKIDVQWVNFLVRILQIIGEILSGIVHFGCVLYFFYLSVISISATYPDPNKNKENIIAFIATYTLCFFCEYLISQKVESLLLQGMIGKNITHKIEIILLRVVMAIIYVAFLTKELLFARKTCQQGEAQRNFSLFHKFYLLYLCISIGCVAFYGGLMTYILSNRSTIKQ